VILFVSGAALWSRKWAARRRTAQAMEDDTGDRDAIPRGGPVDEPDAEMPR
jgi:hypothetical protein